ncbi:hypothetical protein [Amycolatopsis solani]|uniref:hypothetical protein n=1 Tax=Amycolatopsis solani TaxID=3028615 RepID=UPI0025AEF20B|nr:hypothetical protein [Amycolatopsis sp. MEP2-6]
MTSYADAATGLHRPGALLALVGVAVVALADGVLFFVGGGDLALDVAALLVVAVDEVQRTLQVRGGVAVFFGVVLLFWGLLALRGTVWARVRLTLAALSVVVLAWLPPINAYAKARKGH